MKTPKTHIGITPPTQSTASDSSNESLDRPVAFHENSTTTRPITTFKLTVPVKMYISLVKCSP